MEFIAQVQAYTAIAIGIIVGLGALAAALELVVAAVHPQHPAMRKTRGGRPPHALGAGRGR